MRFALENCEQPDSMLVLVHALDASNLQLDMSDDKATCYLYNQVPYSQMWAHDSLWMPHLLESFGKNPESSEYYCIRR